MLNITNLKETVESIITNSALTHEQAMIALSDVPLSYVEFFETTNEFRELCEAGCLCRMAEGNVTYQPRYILPDYEKLMREGCKFLRLDPPENLFEAIQTLEIFYRHVPSVTHYPVYLGSVDKLLEPFMDDENAYKLIKSFLIFLDRSIPDSYCHMNLGPEATRAGEMIVEIETELKNAIPSITLLYDPDITPDDFAEKCVICALNCAKPSFANHKMYRKLYDGAYGIASCYNALPIAGGSFTLSRVVLSRLAERAKDSEHFLEELLPRAVKELCGYIENKIEFLVEKSHFFKSNFLVQEGFVKVENFTGMFGVVGMNECVNTLMEKEHKSDRYGYSEDADQLAIRILEKLQECVNSFESKYCDCTEHHFPLHAQVGIDSDYDISPGARIAIGSELPLHQHLHHCAIIGVGFDSVDALASVAPDYPDQKYASIDSSLVGDNIVSYSCKEQEGSFLVGALAAYMKQDAATYGLEDNHKYGFVGALENDIINHFAAGYRAGIEYVDSDADVAIQYVGGDNPFGDTTTAKEIATTQKGKGYDIIFHAAGGSGLGVFAAAQESDFIAIGANSNQNIIDPDHIVASMLKRVDVAAYDIVKAALEGDLPVGSEMVLGLEDEGIGYTLDGSNIKVPEDVVEKLEEIKEKIIAGEIQVPVEL